MFRRFPFGGFSVSKGHIQMDPAKTQAVGDWPRPTSAKQVQRFLRRFIRNFSAIAAPLTALTRKNVKDFQWTEEAEKAFCKLKDRFTSAPVLTIPDPELPFIVDVDASEVGVGAVLSQRVIKDNKVHPCAFFSHKLSPTERNYDICKRELLADKLAFGRMEALVGGSQTLLCCMDRSQESSLYPKCQETELSPGPMSFIL